MGLKEKTASGLAWNFAGTFLGQAIAFIIGIILARLLSPYEYGLIGMVTIFIAVTQPFINSGFSQALIRKVNCNHTDFSTVFYFNLFVGGLFYAILFFAAPYISIFFNEPQLTKITRLIGLIIIIDAATLIQTTILSKEINFKRQSKISISSSLLSGIFGIYLAYKGHGVWSLVYKTLIQHGLNSIMLWYTNRWRPGRLFSLSSFKEMFIFGSNLLISGIIDKIYYNIYNLFIAKFFSAIALGLYSRADMFKNIVSSNFSEIIAKVALPALSTLQNEPERMFANYKKFLTSTMFFTSILLLGLAASARALILTLIGEKWVDSIIYLQLLCFVGIFYPLIAMTRTLLYAYGESRLSLKIDIISKLMTVPAIIIGIFFGIKAMIIAMIAVSFFEFFLNALFSGRLIGYSVKQQLNDIIPSFLIALLIGGCLFLFDYFLELNSLTTFILQIGFGFILAIGLPELLKIKEYIFIKGIILDGIKNTRKKLI